MRGYVEVPEKPVDVKHVLDRMMGTLPPTPPPTWRQPEGNVTVSIGGAPAFTISLKVAEALARTSAHDKPGSGQDGVSWGPLPADAPAWSHDGKSALMATDGHRMFVYALAEDSPSEDTYAEIGNWVRMLKDGYHGDNSYDIATRLPAGKADPPDYATLISSPDVGAWQQLHFNAAAARTLGELRGAGLEVPVSAVNDTFKWQGDAVTDRDATYRDARDWNDRDPAWLPLLGVTGPIGLKIAFNAMYLGDVARYWPDGFTVHVAGPLAPAVVTALAAPASPATSLIDSLGFFVIMPCRMD